MDLGLLAQSEQITGWLTPVWLIMVGITIGYLLVLLLKGVLYLLSSIPGLNQLNESPQRLVYGILLSVVVAIGLFAYSYGSWVEIDTNRGQMLFAFFLILTSLVFGFGLLALVSRKRFQEIVHQPRGSFANWLSKIAIGAALFAAIGYGLAMVNGFGYITFVDDPNSMLKSLSRLPATGTVKENLTIPARSDAELEVHFYGQELNAVRCLSDQRIRLSAQPFADSLRENEYLEVLPSDDLYTLHRKQMDDEIFPNDLITTIYFQNLGSGEAQVKFDWSTQTLFPQVSIIPQTAATVVMVFLLYWIFCAALPKISAIAISTFKTEISQPVFILLVIIGVVFTVGSIYIPYNTFGEDIKMFKLSGLTLIRIMGIFMAIWAASKSVAEEIEGRTALTVLSKPVGRRQFILGKFSGIALSIGLLFVILGLWFVIWVCYKPIYDGVEASTRDFDWVNGFNEAVKTIPGLALAYLEALVFVAISIAISTRMGILANFMICFSIYVLGHLTPLIVQSAEVAQAFETVVVFGQFISVVFPVLDHFDVEPAIIGEVDVPLTYLGWATIYCIIYGSIAMLLSLVLFEDRDLA